MNAPKLRFSGFFEDWVIKELQNVSNHISYGLTVRPEYISEGIPLISATEIKGGTIDFEAAPKISKKSFELLSQKAIPKKGDIFFSKTGTIGRVAYVESDEIFAITQNIAVIRISKGGYFDKYLLQYLKTPKLQKQAISKVNQSTIMDLQLGDIRELKVPFPKYDEQTKIANFLTAVDDKISQLTKKHELLTLYKKGVMQKIFSQELRFKDDDGREFAEWDKTKLDEIAILFKGKGISKADIEKGGAHPCIRYGELYTEYAEAITKIQSHTNVDPKKHVLSIENDVIIPASGETQIDIATASCVLVGGVILGGDLNIIRGSSNQIFNGIFLSYFLNTKKKLEIAKLAQGNSVVHLYTSQLKELVIDLPSTAEQTKIANFLTAIDDRITNVKSQLEAAKQYKQGLLQQMFV